MQLVSIKARPMVPLPQEKNLSYPVYVRTSVVVVHAIRDLFIYILVAMQPLQSYQSALSMVIRRPHDHWVQRFRWASKTTIAIVYGTFQGHLSIWVEQQTWKFNA